MVRAAGAEGTSSRWEEWTIPDFPTEKGRAQLGIAFSLGTADYDMQ